MEVTETVADANGALLVTLTAHQPGITRVAPTVPEFNLERTPRLAVPPFTHAAQPDLTKCYAGLETLIEMEPRLGFNDPSGAGLAWMKAANQVLFGTSVFHGQFAARGFSVPLAFTYAKDLKLLKKQAAPRMERAFIDHSAKEIARLLLFSHMMAEPWASSEFKVALVALHTCFERTEKRMREDVDRHAVRAQSIMDSFRVRAAEATTSFRAIAVADVVRRCYADLDGALRALPEGTCLNTEMFEPGDYSSRYRFIHEMQLSKPCYMINFDVDGAIGTLHWLVIGEEALGPGALSNELESHRRRLKKLVPAVHARVIKRNGIRRFSDLTSLPASAATYLYKMITGDESHARDKQAAEREAYVARLFTQSEAPAGVILDLRSHANDLRSSMPQFESRVFLGCRP